MSWHVGIDTGGTFTDLAARDPVTGEQYVTKVPSTPHDAAQAIVEALHRFTAEVGASPATVAFFAHGTTVATNAVLEGRGARPGLLLTRGFNAIYEVRGGIRPSRVELIDPRYQKPRPLITLALTRYVTERIGFDGTVLEPLDEDAARSAIRELVEEGVDAIAVLCLFSFMNSTHEERIAELVREEAPECRVSLSSRVLPVIREYPRLSTTALDAYVGPVIARYFEDLERRLKHEGLTTKQSYVMQSNGGLMRFGLAAEHPNEILLSGPASGVAFAVRLGARISRHDLVALDMGGTSTDISVVQNGEVGQTREGRIAGQDVGTPMTEIHTLGAGGGTIAWLGSDGLLKVGPQSAGADPGPACYGRGGAEPTVTDADVVLGYLDPTRFLGGRMQGDPQLAHAALERIGAELELTALEAAVGVNRIVNTHMAVGLRLVLEAKGCDPARFLLLALGGAGPVHAWQLAAETGIRTVAVPPHPGIACARGLLETDIVHTYMQSFVVRIDRASPADVAARMQQLLERALGDAESEGFSFEQLQIVRQMDLRYPHQGYELSLDCPFEVPGEGDLDALRRAFDSEHERIYGVAAPDEPVEIVNVRVRTIVPVELPVQAAAPAGPPAPAGARIGERDAYFESLGGYVSTPVFDRGLLLPGAEVEGPAIVEQLDTTTVVGPGWLGHVDGYGNLVLTRE
jgi:N-methylhydantoinase A